ncbi:unnamed protein product [Porites lobata]|uniref:Uncharacterized protein n=1 Tax=Porites lobata TaxID=104759 RepID=A0ABN8PEN0_9CNID|nr:unnamed protein product [Porites lobata]
MAYKFTRISSQTSVEKDTRCQMMKPGVSFVAFLATFYAFNSIVVTNGKSAATFYNGKGIIVEGNKNTFNLGHDAEIKTALSQIQKRLASLEEKISAVHPLQRACNFDFETGLHGWKKTGTAFNNQPTYGDNPTARKRGQPAKQQGEWWIGGSENRPSKAATPGAVQGDGPQGTLVSPFFKIVGKRISFKIGGGCDIKTVRAELIVDHQVVKSTTGSCSETMSRKFWDVEAFVGRTASVKLVDFSSGGWGHINFDDLRGDISCGQK